MTRINAVPVDDLYNVHAMAEFHELPRIFFQVQEAIKRGAFPQDYHSYATYSMGQSHVLFFYYRLEYIDRRYVQLRDCLTRRGYDIDWGKVRYTRNKARRLITHMGWWNDWTPNDYELAVSWQRINERLVEMGYYPGPRQVVKQG